METSTDVEYSVNSAGVQVWRLKGRLHRLDGPAVILPGGTQEWFRYGKRHRLDGPAIEWPDGSREWHVDGLLHRIDGPAVEYTIGKRREWWFNGEFCPSLHLFRLMSGISDQEMAILILKYGRT